MSRRKLIQPAPSPEELELLEPDFISGDLHVATTTLANWRSKRKGPPWVRVGRRAFYPKVDYFKWKAALPRLGGDEH
jgi:hypothetical protein